MNDGFDHWGEPEGSGCLLPLGGLLLSLGIGLAFLKIILPIFQ